MSRGSVNIKEINRDLFSAQAKDWAKNISSARRINNRTQLRRFYDELEMWYSQVFSLQREEQRKEKLQEILPYIQMMIAKVAYSAARKNVDENFEQMFSGLIRQIETVEDLRHAKLFMEAFLGFYRGYRND